jgi:hypothetical protein
MQQTAGCERRNSIYRSQETKYKQNEEYRKKECAEQRERRRFTTTPGRFTNSQTKPMLARVSGRRTGISALSFKTLQHGNF